MNDVQAAIAEFESRVQRYPAEKYPIQRAAAQFHLGSALAEAERFDEARPALEEAEQLFPKDEMPVERAKAANALGAVLRAQGRLSDATSAFARAVEAFRRSGLALEEGAAVYNLGVVRRQAGDAAAATELLARARGLLDESRAPSYAAAAAYELGAALLGEGKLVPARASLSEAMEMAERSANRMVLGAAANSLGLLLLAEDRPADAVSAFLSAAGAHPRTVRSGEHAMAKANLALAYERSSDVLRARLAARQALCIADAPPAVREQARQTLERVEDAAGGLASVLVREARESRPSLVRDELSRWTTLKPAELRKETAAWIHDQTDSDLGDELAEVWLGGLLELPPEDLTTVVRAALEAQVDDGARDRFRHQVSRAMARFHVPQWMRLKDTFEGIAREVGVEGRWG